MFATGRLANKLSRPGIAFRSLPVTSRIALGVLIVVVLGAVFAPLFTQDPLTTGTPVQAPGGAHWFGTDRAAATSSPGSCTAPATRWSSASARPPWR